jgi:hypothetical protein
MFNLKSLLASVVILGAVLDVGHATQVMHRPDKFNSTPNSFPIEPSPRVHTIAKRAGGKVQIAYFTNWGKFLQYAVEDIHSSMSPFHRYLWREFS